MPENLKIACLRFDSGFHLAFGQSEDRDRSVAILHSDTIAGALCSIRAEMGETDIRGFLDSFRVSSAMPIWYGRLFLPLPPDKSCIRVRGNDPMLKRLKRLQWIEQPLWEQLARDGKLEIEPAMISRCGTAVACGEGREILLLRNSLEQKVCVGHQDGDANPYFFDRVFPGEGVEFGVIYQTDDEAMFRATWNVLSDVGIGTGKTTGNGQFRVDFRKMTIQTPDSDARQLLSMWIPSAEELERGLDPRSSYQLLKRGGYMAGASDPALRNFVKNEVWMIAPGAILLGPNPEGSVVDLRPEGVNCHPVWRDGRAISLPFKYEESHGK